MTVTVIVMGCLVIVASERVVAEVAIQMTPHRVYVVGAALGVVVLGQQTRALDPVVVRP